MEILDEQWRGLNQSLAALFHDFVEQPRIRMRVLSLVLSFFGGLASAFSPSSNDALQFNPQSAGYASAGLTQMPVPYSIPLSNTNLSPLSTNGSYWTATFVHPTNNPNQAYLLITQLIFPFSSDPATSTLYRFSILDITNPNGSQSFASFAGFADPAKTTFYNANGVLDFTDGIYSIGSTSPTDPITSMRIASSVKAVEFDITFQNSAPILLNAGTGQFILNNTAANQWSMPSGITNGWLSLNGGNRVDIDSKRSLTWYDRQWGAILPNYTWFGIHIPGPAADGTEDIIMGIWHIPSAFVADGVNESYSFATIKTGISGDQRVVPIASFIHTDKNFTSPVTGLVHFMEYEIELGDGVKLSVVNKGREDQEVRLPGTGTAFYSALYEVVADYSCFGGGERSGFATIDDITFA